MRREKWKRNTRTVLWVKDKGPIGNAAGKIHNEEFARIYAHGYMTAYGRQDLTQAYSVSEFPNIPEQQVWSVWDKGLGDGMADRAAGEAPPKGFNDFLED